MNGGEISGNTASSGGGVYNNGTFRIVTGTIYGSNEDDTSLRNTANYEPAAALYQHPYGGTTQYGTFAADGITWDPSGYLTTTDDTIIVLDGVLQ
jgi:predicted transcriptional regulator